MKNSNAISTRRSILGIFGAGGLVTMQAAANQKKTVKIAQFDKAGHLTGVADVDRIVKTDAEWRKQLSADAYDVARHKGTERAFMNSFHDNHRDGLYSCVCCGTMLFDSKTKFDSGTGWPSFWKPIDDKAVGEVADGSHGMRRVEVVCNKCQAHLGLSLIHI